MNLLFLSVPGGGLDTNVRVLAPALARAGHRVSVLYLHFPGEKQQIAEAEGARVHHARIGNWHYCLHRTLRGATRLPMIVRALETAWSLKRMIRKISRQDPVDLVELPEGFGTARWLRGVPYAVRLHSSAWMWREMCHEPAPPSDAWERAAEARMLQGARGVSSPSAFVANYIRETCRVRRPIEIIPYPIDTAQFMPAPDRREARAVLFAGRIEKRKGADVLMRAMPLVCRKFPDCEFIFAGNVSAELSAPVTALPGQVRFLGGVPRQELVQRYQQATIFAAPSLWDNSPNTIYEAMACGTPVVATRVGGIPELVDDGMTGMLVPPGDEHALADALLALLSNPAKRARMGKNACEKAVANYSLDKVASATLSFYERALYPG